MTIRDWDALPPEGYEQVEGIPSPPYHMTREGKYYVPCKAGPREWRGTVKALADDSNADLWTWGDDVEIFVREAQEHEREN